MYSNLWDSLSDYDQDSEGLTGRRLGYFLISLHHFSFSITFIDCFFLILLILGNKVVHITFCLWELHFIHALSCVPVQVGLSAEHSCKLLSTSLENLLDSRIIAHKSGW